MFERIIHCITVMNIKSNNQHEQARNKPEAGCAAGNISDQGLRLNTEKPLCLQAHLRFSLWFTSPQLVWIMSGLDYLPLRKNHSKQYSAAMPTMQPSSGLSAHWAVWSLRLAWEMTAHQHEPWMCLYEDLEIDPQSNVFSDWHRSQTLRAPLNKRK